MLAGIADERWAWEAQKVTKVFQALEYERRVRGALAVGPKEESKSVASLVSE